jgi:creatinine amidohydrolase/Fe(II)-dependent formamide hydrolase-like protein
MFLGRTEMQQVSGTLPGEDARRSAGRGDRAAPGTLSRVLIEIGEGIHRPGLRKLVLGNSHGGKDAVLASIPRELGVRSGLLVAATKWSRAQVPALYDPMEEKSTASAAAMSRPR